VEERWLASRANKDAIEQTGVVGTDGGRGEESGRSCRIRMRRGDHKGVTTITDRRRRRRRLSGAPRKRMRHAAPSRRSLSHPTCDPFFSPSTSLTRKFFSLSLSHTHTHTHTHYRWQWRCSNRVYAVTYCPVPLNRAASGRSLEFPDASENPAWMKPREISVRN